MDLLAGMPVAWGQSGAGADADALAILAFRRWCSSLTLSPPEAAPRPFGPWAWLIGLGSLLLIALVAQGPRRALGQLFDVPGHARLLAAAMLRLRRSGRLVGTLLVATVLAWTASEFSGYEKPERQADLVLLRKSKGLGELAAEQGALAALTPWRDVVGLGDLVLLTVVASALAFRFATDRWAGRPAPGREPSEPGTGRATLAWGSASLSVMYRAAALMGGADGLPFGGCLAVEAVVVPILMVLVDGLLLAWVLSELRGAEVPEGGPLDVGGALGSWPGSALACVLAMPARYVAAGVWLAWPYLPVLAARELLGAFVRGWGLIAFQGAALATAGILGAAAWAGGTPEAALLGYGRLLRAEGGRLVALLAGAGVAAGALSATAYALLWSLPAQAWVLAAADSYAHYATLPVGLLVVSSLVELGRRAIPPQPPAAEAPEAW